MDNQDVDVIALEQSEALLKGLLQGVLSDNDEIRRLPAIQIDYDAEDEDEEDITPVPQSNGKTEDAVVSSVRIEKPNAKHDLRDLREKIMA